MPTDQSSFVLRPYYLASLNRERSGNKTKTDLNCNAEGDDRSGHARLRRHAWKPPCKWTYWTAPAKQSGDSYYLYRLLHNRFQQLRGQSTAATNSSWTKNWQGTVGSHVCRCLSVKFHTKALIATVLHCLKPYPIYARICSSSTPAAVLLVHPWLYPCCARTCTCPTSVIHTSCTGVEC